MLAWGVFGCKGGHRRAYTNVASGLPSIPNSRSPAIALAQKATTRLTWPD